MDALKELLPEDEEDEEKDADDEQRDDVYGRVGSALRVERSTELTYSQSSSHSGLHSHRSG